MIKGIVKEDVDKWYNIRKCFLPNINKSMHYFEMNDILGDKNKYCVFVEEVNEKFVGLLEVSISEFAPGCHTSPICRIDTWYVNENYRKKGIGKKLVLEAEKWAQRNKCYEIGSIVDMKNTNSIKIHKKIGYIETTIDDMGINFIKEVGIQEKYFGKFDVSLRYNIRNKLGLIILNNDNDVAIDNINGVWKVPFSIMKEREYFETAIKRKILNEYGYNVNIEKFICKASEYIHDTENNKYVKEQEYFYTVELKEKMLSDINKDFHWVNPKKAIKKVLFSNEAWALTEVCGSMIYI